MRRPKVREWFVVVTFVLGSVAIAWALSWLGWWASLLFVGLVFLGLSFAEIGRASRSAGVDRRPGGGS